MIGAHIGTPIGGVLHPAGIVAAVFTASGAATFPADAISITTAVFAASGAGAAANVGAGLRSTVMASAGVAGGGYAGAAYFAATFNITGTSFFVSPVETLQIVSLNMLQLPVDCVMAGNQREFKSGRAHLGALRGIFNE